MRSADKSLGAYTYVIREGLIRKTGETDCCHRNLEKGDSFVETDRAGSKQ